MNFEIIVQLLNPIQELTNPVQEPIGVVLADKSSNFSQDSVQKEDKAAEFNEGGGDKAAEFNERGGDFFFS